MERSQSCSNFDTTVSTAEPGMRMPAHKTPMAQLKQSNSQILLSNTQNHQTKQTLNNYPTATTLRRKNFQRQRTATFSDDTEYAGDLDEEPDEDDEVMHVVYETIMPGMLNTYARQRTNFHPTLPAHSETTYNATARVVHYTKTSRLSHSTPATNDTKTNSVLPTHRLIKHEESFDSSSTTADTTPSPTSPRQHYAASLLTRDNSLHSDSSRYSSVDSLLEARKPDPEAILINLGFGPAGTDDILSRIPKRFLKPSQVPGNDTEAFVKRLQLANNLADHSVLGYRGLTGNPDIPPSSIVAKIMQRFEVNERKKSMGSIEHAI